MARNEALSILEDIRTTTLANAAPVPSESTNNVHWQGLGLQVGGVRLVCPMSEVAEVLNMPRLTRLPVVKDWVLGVANVRGRLIPVLDLHGFLGMRSTTARSHWRVVVVEDEDLIAGFVVEQSLGIQYFPDEAYADQDDASDVGELASYVSGIYRHGGRVFHEIRLRRLLRDDAFFEVSA